MTHQTSLDQDLRTALASDDVRHLDPELWAAFDKAIAEGIAHMMQEDGYEGLTSPSDVSQGIASDCLASVLTRQAALTPAQAPDKAGERDGVDAVAEKRRELAEREIASLRKSNRSLAALLWPDEDAEGTAATKGPLFVHDFADPAVSSSPGPHDVTLSCDHPATITVASMGNGMTGTLEEARANAAKIARLWNSDLASQPSATEAHEKPGWFDPVDDDRDDVIALLKETNAWQAKRINELLACSQPNGTEASRGVGPDDGLEPGEATWRKQAANWGAWEHKSAVTKQHYAALEAATPTPPLSPDSTRAHEQMAREIEHHANAEGEPRARRDRLLMAAHLIRQMAALPPSAPIAAPVRELIEDAPEDEDVILFTEGKWVGEARMLRDEDTGEQIWTWANGTVVHSNNKPQSWQSLPSWELTTDAIREAGGQDWAAQVTNSLDRNVGDEIAAALRHAHSCGYTEGHTDGEVWQRSPAKVVPHAGKPIKDARELAGSDFAERRAEGMQPRDDLPTFAAPVRDDGALAAIVARLCDASCDQIGWQTPLELEARALLASLPAPAGDVPGEAQTHSDKPAIVEASHCLASERFDWSLTIEWPDGTETVEEVTEKLAKHLGFDADNAIVNEETV